MKRSILFSVVVVSALSPLSCSSDNSNSAVADASRSDATPGDATQSSTFTLSSSLKAGEFVDAKYYGGGCKVGSNNEVPSLTWANAPAGTKSFAVTFYDKDAPTGSGFWHWVLYNIPATTTSLAGGKDGGTLPTGAVQGVNDNGKQTFFGPCPPTTRQHRYVYTVHALKIEKLDEVALKDAGPAYMGFNLWQNDLATATFEVKAGDPAATNTEVPTLPTFTLSAESVQTATAPVTKMTSGQKIPADQYASKDLGLGCDGQSMMPKLTWTAGPQYTIAYAVTFYDKDAPTGSGFWHRVIYNIPAEVTSPPGTVKGGSLPGGVNGGPVPQGATEGKTDLGKPGFFGPCPPPGREHTYVYTVYALKAMIGTGSTASPPADTLKDSSPAYVGFNILNNALAKATFEVKAGPRAAASP